MFNNIGMILATGAGIFVLGFGLFVEKAKMMKEVHDIKVSFWSPFLIMAFGTILFLLGLSY